MKKEGVTRVDMREMANKYTNFFAGFVTPKRLFFFLVILYAASLVPLLWIGGYDYPAADDYTFGAACRNVWMEKHSVLSVVVCAARRAWDCYLSWTGCMSSSFFMALQPGVFGEGLYKVTPLLMIGITSAGVFYFMNVVFVKLLKGNFYLIHSITALMLFVTMQCMPEPAEGLFWYNGALHYTFMNGISLFFYGGLISALGKKDMRQKRRGCMVSAVFGLIAGMGNYMTALNVGIVLSLFIAVLVIGKRFRGQWFLVIPSVCFYGSFILNVVAPGNAVRAETSNGMNPVKAVFVSFYYVLDYCFGEWSGWVVLVLAVITATLFWNVSKDMDFKFPYPLFVVSLNYCILAAMVTPPLFGSGNIEAGRIRSLIYMMYIFLLTLTICYVTGWLQKRLDGSGGTADTNSGGGGGAVVCR